MRMHIRDVSKKIAFVAVDSGDGFTRKTGVSSWTVYYSLNGATPVAMTTPTVTELSAANMPGVYILDIDETGMVAEPGELTLHITATGVAPITRAIEIGEEWSFTVLTDTGNTASTFKTDLSETTDDYHKAPALVRFITGNLKGQVRRLAATSAYNGTTKFLTVADGFTAAPANGDRGVIINF